MKLLLLGRGKTGSLVADVARERGHEVHAVGAAENHDGGALRREAVEGFDVAIDFTTPHVVLGNVADCCRAGLNVVVGTTGWYDQMEQVRDMVRRSDIGFVFGGNFSVGVNLFFEIVRAAAPALSLGYSGAIIERHHAQKKDKPSGTAAVINNVLKAATGKGVEIESVREGNIVGEHDLMLKSAADTITLAHVAKSRRGFAEGAVKAAEWLKGRKGFYDFKDVWRQL